METQKNIKSNLANALYTGLFVFFLVFFVFILFDLSIITSFKWGLGLGFLSFFWQLSRIGKLIDALFIGGIN